MIINGSFKEPWGDDEPRESKLVFIGKNLDGASLAAGFNACLVTPSNMKKKTDALRFAVGDHVECNMDGWESGVVVGLLYHDNTMEPVSATQGSNQRPRCSRHTPSRRAPSHHTVHLTSRPHTAPHSHYRAWSHRTRSSLMRTVASSGLHQIATASSALSAPPCRATAASVRRRPVL